MTMTVLAMKREQTVLLDGLTELIGKCQNASFADILRSAALRIKTDRLQPESARKRRLSDEELAALLASEPEFDIETYSEPSDDEWREMSANSRGKLSQGLEKWL